MKKLSFLIVSIVLFGSTLFAQVGINSDGNPSDNSAMLDVKSTTRGFLPPRMTTLEMNAILSPATGLLVYNTTVNSLYWFDGSAWKRINDPYTETDPIFISHPASGITTGNITNWNTAYANRILSASGTLPLSLSIAGNQLSGSIVPANSITNGYLTSTDWNNFNNKVSSQWVTSGQNISYSNGKVGIGSSAPTASASLEVTSTTTGVLLPRMTRVQRNDIAVPAAGLMVYCINCGTSGSLSIFTNGSWITFSPCAIAAPVAGTHVMSQGQIIWNWQSVAGAAGYKWSTTTDYESATEMATATTKTETGTACGITYTRYVWAYSSCGESAMATLTAIVAAAVPAAPVAATHVPSQTAIVWNWNTVAGATGYKWNTTNNYGTATEMGTNTTKTETGLTCSTSYTRYGWAYNSCGYSPPVTLTQSTWTCGTCGTLSINHVQGVVAPVSKILTYGTVTDIPGEPAKCWITRNLGSDHQATAVSDATEASAGWYWQFNLKQGYKHDGTNRTPNTVWKSSINETSEWITANDPCTIELGAGWRIPTVTEWINVDAAAGGNWIDWNGPWGSGLKLHAAGYLTGYDASLGFRGSNGTYWSSAQYDVSNGWYLNFDSGSCYMSYYTKAYGFSVRCVRDF